MTTIFLVLTPIELLATQIISLPVVFLLVPRGEHRFSRFMPLTFAALGPIVVILMNNLIKLDCGSFFRFPHVSVTLQICLVVVALSAAFTKPKYFTNQFLKYPVKLPFINITPEENSTEQKRS